MWPKIVLFLCTGNYYRSRFAELLFNHLAERRGFDWQASSRGLALNARNVGAISQDTLIGLATRGIAVEGEVRHPQALGESDMASAHHIVAVNHAEHLPMLQRKFPHRVEEIEFWHVHELDLATPVEALAQLEREVLGLVSRLHALDQALRSPTG